MTTLCEHSEAVARFLLPVTVDTAVSICFQCKECGEMRQVATLDTDWKRLWKNGTRLDLSAAFKGRAYFSVPADLPKLDDAWGSEFEVGPQNSG